MTLNNVIDGVELELFPGYKIFRDGSITGRKGYKLQPIRMPKGYEVVSVYDSEGVQDQVSIHRLIAAAYLGLDICDRDLEVDHLDKIKHHNWVSNLEVVTGLENQRRAWSHLHKDNTDTLKRCSKCGVLKSRIFFKRHPNTVDKLRHHCTECVAAKSREYYKLKGK